jgi:hypothetical protein
MGAEALAPAEPGGSRAPVPELFVEVDVFGRDLGLGDQGDFRIGQLAGAQDDAVPATERSYSSAEIRTRRSRPLRVTATGVR